MSYSADLIAKALVTEKVTDVFGVTGSHVVDVFHALHGEQSVRIVAAKHEGGASFMAAAYARVSGKVGICVTTAGPGVLNALNGLAQAQFSALPVICLSGSVPVGAASFDLHGLGREEYCLDAVRPLVKEGFRVNSVTDLADCIARSFQIARSGRPGPVYIEVPWNLFSDSAERESIEYSSRPVESLQFSSDIIKDVVENLRASVAPVLVLDKGVMGGGAATLLAEFAQDSNFPIMVTRDAIGAIADNHPCYAGVVHEHQFGPFAFDALMAADYCVGIGFDVDSQNGALVQASVGGKVTFVGTAGDASATSPDGLTLSGLVKSIVEESQMAPEPIGQPAFTNLDRTTSVENMRAGLLACATQKPMHFGYALSVLARHLVNDAITLLDAGSHEVWARNILPINNDSSLIGGNDWASMGFAVPATVGVRAAYPTRRLVCITGDGCLLMSLSDLSTLIEAGGPTLIVNLNDSEYGMMSHVQRAKYGQAQGNELPEIDFARIASEFGAKTRRVENPQELDDVFAEAIALAVPYFIDLICDSTSGYPVYEQAARNE